MSDSERGQVGRSAAEVYEEFFVPALFGDWPERVLDAAGVGEGHRVLDVACGTGVLARAARGRVGADGSVAGVDVNDGMLDVARRVEPGVEWKVGAAESLPFSDDTFDAVVSQFGLMFFEDRIRALREMVRVLDSRGRLSFAVWASLDDTPGYAAAVRLLDRMFGREAGDALRAPYNLGDPAVVKRLVRDSGIGESRIVHVEGEARFPSVRSWMHTDVRGWTLSDLIDDDGFERLVAEAEREMRPFVGPDGTVAFPAPAWIVSAEKA